MRKLKATVATTPAAAPTPALKAIVCVSGIGVSEICWFVGRAVLADPVLVVEARLEACDLLLEEPLVCVEVVEIIETVDDVDTAADELCAAELGATTSPVLVCCSPTTPMIVCAVPSET
jgi:hypothetical protein